MTRYLSFLFLLILFGNSVFTAVIPKSYGSDDHEVTAEREDEPGNDLVLDDMWSLEDGSGSLNTRATDAADSSDEAALLDERQPLAPEDLSASKRDDTSSTDLPLSDTIVARAPEECRRALGTGVDSCKKSVQSGVANCKKKIQDDIAKCKVDAKGEIDRCKKKAKDPFSKARCESRRPKLMAQCESRRAKIPLCEKARPKVLLCCERMRPQFQALCAIPSFPVSVVRSRLQDAQQQCMKGFII
ncbi:hypothetical protein NYO67_8581 [Aspergillus flavus]|nr:hypothetical protein NYO67_8581 [Aspergillus flavus]